MAIQGLRTDADFVTNQRPENWREGLALLYPNGKMPLTAMTSMMKKKTVTDARTHWWDKKLATRRLKLHTTNGDLDANAGTQTLTLDATDGNGLQVKEGEILRVEESDELLRVVADPSVNTSIQVLRGFAGTTPTAVDADGSGVNFWLQVVGSAYEQGSLAPTGVSFDPVERDNRTQIFRNALEMARTAMKTRLRTPDQVKEAKRETLELHGIDIEMALWQGKKSTSTVNGKPLTTMDGVFQFIDTNNVIVADTKYASGVSMENLETELELAFRYGSSEKVGICGNIALLTLQRIVRKNTTWQIVQGLKEAGMNVSRLVCPFGEVVLKSHPMWNYNVGGTNTTAFYGMNSWLAILDMDNFRYVHFEGDDFRYEPDIQVNGLDGMKSAYITECSIEVEHPLSHYLIKNLHTAVADS